MPHHEYMEDRKKYFSKFLHDALDTTLKENVVDS